MTRNEFSTQCSLYPKKKPKNLFKNFKILKNDLP